VKLLLAKAPLFSELNDDEQAEILSLARPFRFDQGHAIFRQGDRADGMYLIEDGRVRVSARLPNEGEVELSILGSGEVLGEFALIDGRERSATATAIQEARGLFFSSRHFDVLRSELRPAAFKTMRRITRELIQRLEVLNRDIDASSTPSNIDPLPPWVRGPSEIPGNPVVAANLNRSALRVLPFFRLLSEEELEEFLSALHCWDVPRGQILFRQGSTGMSSFVIIRGAIQVALEKNGGFEKVALLGPGRIFGLALIEGSRRIETCYVRERAILLEIRQEHFARWFESTSPVAFKFHNAINENLVAQLRASDRRLGRLSALDRMK
jgi:CRP/FNR family cyclic AMP-dependent transcriptional regulator